MVFIAGVGVCGVELFWATGLKNLTKNKKKEKLCSFFSKIMPPEKKRECPFQSLSVLKKDNEKWNTILRTPSIPIGKIIKAFRKNGGRGLEKYVGTMLSALNIHDSSSVMKVCIAAEGASLLSKYTPMDAIKVEFSPEKKSLSLPIPEIDEGFFTGNFDMMLFSVHSRWSFHDHIKVMKMILPRIWVELQKCMREGKNHDNYGEYALEFFAPAISTGVYYYDAVAEIFEENAISKAEAENILENSKETLRFLGEVNSQTLNALDIFVTRLDKNPFFLNAEKNEIEITKEAQSIMNITAKSIAFLSSITRDLPYFLENCFPEDILSEAEDLFDRLDYKPNKGVIERIFDFIGMKQIAEAPITTKCPAIFAGVNDGGGSLFLHLFSKVSLLFLDIRSFLNTQNLPTKNTDENVDIDSMLKEGCFGEATEWLSGIQK